MRKQRIHLWRLFIWGRTAVSAAFLGILLLINGFQWSPRLYPIFLVSLFQFAINFPYLYIWKSRDIEFLGYITFSIEIVIISLLILNFGNDGYVFLLAYLWPLMMAGWFIGHKAILPLALFSSVAYGTLLVLRHYALIYTDHVLMPDGSTPQALILATLYLGFSSLLLWALTVERERGEQALARHNQRLRALVQASGIVVGSQKLDSLLQTTLNQAQQLAGTNRLGIYLFENGQFELQAAKDLPSSMAPPNPSEYVSADWEISHDWEQYEPIIKALSRNKANRLVSQDELAATALHIPLCGTRGLVGVIALILSSKQDPNEQERWGYQIFGHQVGISIENAQLIEQLRRETETLTAVLTHMSEGVFVVGPKQEVLLANRASSKLLGVEKGETLPAWLIERLADDAGTERNGRLLVTSGEKVISLTLALLPQVDRLPKSTIFVAQDFTHEARVEKMKTDFVAYASHELRTPLTTIKMLIGLMRMHQLDQDKRAEYLSIIDTQIERQTRLVNNLLDLTRLESGSYKLVPEQIRLPLIIDPIIQSFAPLAEEKRIELTCDIQSNHPIMANASGIEQIVTNLLSNAIKFTPEGGWVTVSCVEEDDQIAIIVEDSGIGMSLAETQRIFDKFYTVRNPKKRGEGTGLGLAISKMMAQEMQGTIDVNSVVGEGSIFTLRLPNNVSSAHPQEQSADIIATSA